MEQLQQRVALRDLRFYAFHGYYAEEQILGNEFIVEIETVFTPHADTEVLDGTVDYEEVYRMAREEMEHPRKLLETPAKAILNRIRRQYPFVQEVRVQIIKVHPPFGGDRAAASVTLSWKL